MLVVLYHFILFIHFMSRANWSLCSLLLGLDENDHSFVVDIDFEFNLSTINMTFSQFLGKLYYLFALIMSSVM